MSNEEIPLDVSNEEIPLDVDLRYEMKYDAIPFMEPFQTDYTRIIPLASEKGFIYDVALKVCNEGKLYDINETGEGIVKGNVVSIPQILGKKPRPCK